MMEKTPVFCAWLVFCFVVNKARQKKRKREKERA